MDSSDLVVKRHRTLHQIFGEGIIADVILWRRKNITSTILLVSVAFWVVFERLGHTLVSLVSSVLLLLVSILFLWSKSAVFFNRPMPPLPELHVPKEMAIQAMVSSCHHVNILLSLSKDVCLGKNTKLFFKAATCLCLVSLIGGLVDFLTFFCSIIIFTLSMPVMYEKYEDCINSNVERICKTSRQLCIEFASLCYDAVLNLHQDHRLN